MSAALKKLIEAAKPLPDEFSEGMRTARDIMQQQMAPAHYCVTERVPSGLVVMGARPKFKKSWYALQLALAKAMGGQFMGVKTPACDVLGLFLEDNDRRMQKRYDFFGITPHNAPANLRVFYEWPTGLEGVERIHRFIDKYPDTGLIIVDVLQRFRGPRERNANVYDADYQTMGLLHGITKRCPGLTVLVIHHVKKGAVEDPIEAINGSFGIAGAADAFIILRRGSEKDQVVAHIDGRDWESWDHEFLWEFRSREGWVQIGTNEVTLTEHQQEVMRYARDAGYMTPTKLAELRQVGKSTAAEALKALVTKGAMRVHAGKYYPNGGAS